MISYKCLASKKEKQITYPGPPNDGVSGPSSKLGVSPL